jgi:hypothetical protein
VQHPLALVSGTAGEVGDVIGVLLEPLETSVRGDGHGGLDGLHEVRVRAGVSAT